MLGHLPAAVIVTDGWGGTATGCVVFAHLDKKGRTIIPSGRTDQASLSSEGSSTPVIVPCRLRGILGARLGLEEISPFTPQGETLYHSLKWKKLPVYTMTSAMQRGAGTGRSPQSFGQQCRRGHFH